MTHHAHTGTDLTIANEIARRFYEGFDRRFRRREFGVPRE
jgi:hypothetical protein